MKWLTTEVYSVLYYLTTGPFSAEIFHCWVVFCRNSSQLGRFLLGCSLQKYFTAGPFTAMPISARLFSAEIFHRWAVFCRNSSQLGRFLLGHFLLGCSLQKYFTTGPFTARPISAGLFSAKIFHHWAIYR